MRSTKEIIADIGTGWNLGNSMDCFGGETAWHNPRTTKEMIDEVAAGGFNLIRLPVTWHEQTGPAPEYIIRAEWLNRVKELVDYAYSNGMYVIVNMHHENKWIIPQREGFDHVMEQYKMMWKQIAEFFKAYDDHLLFEALNEPRIEYSENEWTGGSKENREYVNRLEQCFVDMVRSTGGNNKERSLLVTTVGASTSEEAVSGLRVPQDKNIIVSVHPYVPHHFCYAKDEVGSLVEWDGSLQYEIDEVMERLDRVYLRKGIPVIITEYGAVNKQMVTSAGETVPNELEVIKWAKYYLKQATRYGIPCIWWDNGYYSSGDEYFGIFNREKCDWYTPSLKEAIIENTR
jgi:endoglucanase